MSVFAKKGIKISGFSILISVAVFVFIFFFSSRFSIFVYLSISQRGRKSHFQFIINRAAMWAERGSSTRGSSTFCRRGGSRISKGGVDGRPYLLRGGRENANFCAKSGGRRRNVA